MGREITRFPPALSGAEYQTAAKKLPLKTCFKTVRVRAKKNQKNEVNKQ